MTLEEIRLGRKMRSRIVSVTIAAPTVFRGAISSAPNRVSLVIFPHVTQRIALSTEGDPATETSLTIQAGGSPVYLNVKDHGDIVTKRFDANGTGNPTPLHYIETFCDEQ